MYKLLETLCNMPAPSGCEEGLFSLIADTIRPYVDEIKKDPLGNLIAHKKGSGKKLMFCAHMDEIGLVATCHGEKGQVYVSNLGGVSFHSALYQRVRYTGGAEGVLVPGEKEEDVVKKPALSKLYVDIGAQNEEEAKEQVSVGEGAVFVGNYRENGDIIISKALDNRVGCFVLIEAIKNMSTYTNDLYFVFTVSEELGLRGAKAVANSVCPDYAVALDVTPAGDTPGGDKNAVSLGGGVGIKIMDKSMLAHPYMKETMMSVCSKQDIPYQPEVLAFGGTDAGAVHTTGGGVPSGCISVPTRYVHTPGEMVSKKDIEGAIRLATALIEAGMQ